MASQYQNYRGYKLVDLPVPCAILDRAVVRRNCKQMLAICEKLDVRFRAHIKTHKTAEVAAEQIPSSCPTLSLIVSTLLEAEHILPLLQSRLEAGQKISLLYGVPLPPSQVQRLESFASRLDSPGAISILADHPAQLDALRHSSLRPNIFLKIDTGYGRAGVPSHASSHSLRALCEAMQSLQADGRARMQGFYSHGGDSYGASNANEALSILTRELRGLEQVVSVAKEVGLHADGHGFVLSVGATPNVSSAWLSAEATGRGREVVDVIEKIKSTGDVVEFHAGNYPILDMQQIATGAGLSSTSESQSGDKAHQKVLGDLALTILAEVNSKYEERTTEECLITAGCLALGREPCKSYDGWGVVSAWPRPSGLKGGSGWYVHSISQEHGKIKRGRVPDVPIVEEDIGFMVGDKVRIWPNHACIAAANFPVFFVVDSEDENGGEVVKEIWERCRGW